MHFNTANNEVLSISSQNESIYVSSRDQHLYALEKHNGGLLWKCRFDYPTFHTAAIVGNVAYIGGAYALNRVDGTLLWHKDLKWRTPPGCLPDEQRWAWAKHPARAQFQQWSRVLAQPLSLFIRANNHRIDVLSIALSLADVPDFSDGDMRAFLVWGLGGESLLSIQIGCIIDV